jgi:hypothetical protein
VIAAADVLPALSEVAALALTIWGEARNESPHGQIAVGQVILHRRATGRWGATVNSVVGARLQFSCWWPQGGQANYAALMATTQRVLRGEAPKGLGPCLWVAGGLLDGLLARDLVKGATHYMTRELWLSKPPAWARGVVPVATVDAHVFFAGVA